MNKILKESLLLYAITDRAWTGEKTIYQQVEEALEGGITCLQLREKDLPYTAFYTETIVIKGLCKKYNVPLIINDDVKLAIECNSDGIHVGQGDMNIRDIRQKYNYNGIIGVSAGNIEQALKAEADGADYIGVGAVFNTNTKKDIDVISLETLKQICDTVNIPVVAIGGINDENIKMLYGSGVSGISVISAVFGSENIKEECQKLIKECSKL